MTDTTEKFLNPSQLSAYTDGTITATTFYRLVREGVLGAPVVLRVGRRLYVNRVELDEWIRSGGAGFPGGWRKLPAA